MKTGLNNTVNKTHIQFNDSIHICLDTILPICPGYYEHSPPYENKRKVEPKEIAVWFPAYLLYVPDNLKP